MNPYAIEPYAVKAQLLEKYQDVVGAGWYQKAKELLQFIVNRDPVRMVHTRVILAKLLESGGESREAMRVMLDGLLYSSFLSNLDVLQYGKELSIRTGNRFAENSFNYWIESDLKRGKVQLEQWRRELDSVQVP